MIRRMYQYLFQFYLQFILEIYVDVTEGYVNLGYSYFTGAICNYALKEKFLRQTC